MSVRDKQLKQAETLKYCPGGFHPIHLGDKFKKDRYNVIHKLGQGGFAAVWLARDNVRNRYVALKVLAARLSRECPEVEILRRIKNAPEGVGKVHVMSMLDHFFINGPNGRHLCVVSQVGGPSIKQFNDCPGQSPGTRRLRAAVARKLALQATSGLAYIHSTGTVHGDFTSANILIQLANIDQWTEEQIYDRLGKPQTQTVHPIPPSSDQDSSKPRYTIEAIDMKMVDACWLSDHIIIIDFGIAFSAATPSREIGTPKSYCAPEFLFGCGRSVNSDVWALGCTIFEMRTGVRLFRYKTKPSPSEMLQALVTMLGPLPEKWWADWESGRDWYAEAAGDEGALHGKTGGRLSHHIMEVGVHDAGPSTPPPERRESQSELDHDSSQGSTSRLAALVNELTTSEVLDVLAQLNDTDISDENGLDVVPEEDEEEPAAKEDSMTNSGSGNKTSSGDKSGEKSISSEGMSTGVAPADTDQPDAPDSLNGAAQKEDDADGPNPRGSAKRKDLLEPAGTKISARESESMEALLRLALAYIPEDRVSPLDMAEHEWFSDSFKD